MGPPMSKFCSDLYRHIRYHFSQMKGGLTAASERPSIDLQEPEARQMCRAQHGASDRSIYAQLCQSLKTGNRTRKCTRHDDCGRREVPWDPGGHTLGPQLG